MHEIPEPIIDKNSGGIGLVLRLAGCLLPPAIPFALRYFVRTSPPEWLSSGFRVIAFLWAWPFGMWNVWPVFFGVLVLSGLLMSVIVFIRGDRGGAATVLAFTFAWGWILSAIIGTAQGS